LIDKMFHTNQLLYGELVYELDNDVINIYFIVWVKTLIH